MFAMTDKPKQLNTSPAEIIIVHASEQYVEQMENLQRIAYGDDPEILHAEEFRSHLHYFPQGQFIAIDTATDTVVGLTASMRLKFSPSEDLLETWRATTGDG
jgi:hypothetical protein